MNIICTRRRGVVDEKFKCQRLPQLLLGKNLKVRSCSRATLSIQQRVRNTITTLYVKKSRVLKVLTRRIEFVDAMR